MEQGYHLNIAKVIREDRSTHYARVDLGLDKETAIEKAKEFAKLFPEGDKVGCFKLTLTYWECIGHAVNF